MFRQFYGMREQPFGVTPDSRYLHFSRTHREALASLFCGIQDRRGFLALIAPPGTGKTTLLFYLLERLRPSARTVFMFDTPSDPQDLMSYLAADLGLNRVGVTTADIRLQFHNLLREESQAGRNVVIVVDEAQNLTNPVLEQLRMLSNFESGTHKLLQVVLAGQPPLATRLTHPHLVQLRQRLAIVTEIKTLTHEEVCAYVKHRLSVARCDSELLFTRDALALVASESKGIPRNINTLCYNALALGCALKRKPIDVGIIKRAANDLALQEVSGDCEIRDNNRSVHRGTNKRYRVGIPSASRTRPLSAALTKISVGVAILLIIIPLGVISRARPKLELKSQVPLTRPAFRPTAAPKPAAPISETRWAAATTATIHKPFFVTRIRYWSESTSTTVGIELEEQLKYEVHRLTSPDRVYLDFYPSRLKPALPGKEFQIDDKIVRKIRIAELKGMLTRVTLETYGPCDFSVTATPDRPELLVELRSMQQQLHNDAALHNAIQAPN
jgi:type II secretory pathway predicted ATPase ExeA